MSGPQLWRLKEFYFWAVLLMEQIIVSCAEMLLLEVAMARLQSQSDPDLVWPVFRIGQPACLIAQLG